MTRIKRELIRNSSLNERQGNHKDYGTTLVPIQPGSEQLRNSSFKRSQTNFYWSRAGNWNVISSNTRQDNSIWCKHSWRVSRISGKYRGKPSKPSWRFKNWSIVGIKKRLQNCKNKPSYNVIKREPYYLASEALPFDGVRTYWTHSAWFLAFLFLLKITFRPTIRANSVLVEAHPLCNNSVHSFHYPKRVLEKKKAKTFLLFFPPELASVPFLFLFLPHHSPSSQILVSNNVLPRLCYRPLMHRVRFNARTRLKTFRGSSLGERRRAREKRTKNA